jgi:hypothetical protein
MNTGALEKTTKRILTRQELTDLLCPASRNPAETYACIETLVKEGKIKPVLNSGTNGNMQYPLYGKYRITIKHDYSRELDEIRSLNPLLSGNGYLLRHPEIYAKYQEVILALNHWLFHHDSDLEISRKERSYEIFGQEKLLDDAKVRGLLKKIGMNQEILAFYDTPEYCFSDYILHFKKDQMHFLICENKDIWFNIRRLMSEEGIGTIFGVSFDGVVYGAGNNASLDHALQQYIAFAGYGKVTFSYWGDIDRSGLEIYQRVVKNNPDLQIDLFVPAYHIMLERAWGHAAESSKDQRRHDLSSYEDIYALFDQRDAERMKQMMEENRLIPQEIISYRVLKEECKAC